MTASEMMYEAEIMYESIASADARGYEPREWSVLLTQAQENILKSICRQGFDKDEINRRKVSKLIEFVEIDTGFEAVGNLIHSWMINADNFPSNYYHRISGRVNAEIVLNPGTPEEDTIVVSNVKLTPVDYNFVDANFDNPYRKPYEKEYWLLTGKEGHIILTDGKTPTLYKLEYIKKAPPIIVETLESGEEIEGETAVSDCILDSITHREIVTEAARLAYAYLKDQAGYQIQSNERINQ